VIVEIVGVVTARRFGVDITRGATPLPASYSNTQELGLVLYTQYAYPFELAAVVLLVAIVAAIALTTRARRGLKHQNINRQVSVKSTDRVRLVKSMNTKAP
jgi:NADH-quinone oxidoreductase subunit J